MGLAKPGDDPRLKQLDRILSSEAFNGLGRQGRFLRFVVEESLSGRADRIKEYSVGLEVYEKPESWDPKIDSTVRSEASKLRARLAAYYETTGIHDSIVISVPKGTYVPTFTSRNILEMREPAPAASTPVLVPAVPRSPRWYFLAAAFVLVLAGALAAWFLRKSPQSPALPKRITSDLAYNTNPALSREGKLVAYASDRAGHGDLDIWIKPVTGGEPLRLTTDPANESEPDISPDGSLVAYVRENQGAEVWIVAALGGTPQLLARDGRRPRFSPDGSQIAYFSADMGVFHSSIPTGKIFVQPVSGGKSRRIAANFAVAVEPLWISPTRLLFRGHPTSAGFWSTSADWFIADLESSKITPTGVAARFAAQRICHASSSFTPAAWTGSAVIVAINCDGLRDLWRVPLSEPATRLTFGNTAASLPSAAGENIAFASVDNRGSIWEILLDPATERPTGGPRRLTSNAAPERLPSLSPDGKWMAFTSERNGNEDVVLRNLESGAETLVAAGPNRETHAGFSPDGRSIIWTEVISEAKPPGGLRHRAWRRDLEGGPLQLLCDPCAYGGPAPDGKRYLDLDGEQKIGIVQVDPAAGRRSGYLAHPQHDLFLVTPSPDRRWMAFNVRYPDDDIQTYIAPFRDPAPPQREWIPLGKGGSTAWSLSSRFLYFMSARDANRCLWRQAFDPISGRTIGPPDPVAHFHSAASRLAPGPDVFSSLSVSRDRIGFTVTENTGNIWLLRP